MDEISQKELERIAALEVEAWTPADFAFMRARRSYLSEEQCKAFGLDNEAAPESTDHVITQEDLDNNPGLAADVKVGDVVQLPNPKPLEEMTKSELTDIAATFGIQVGTFESKASVIEKIHAAEASAAPQN